jgi:hypothetical protein
MLTLALAAAPAVASGGQLAEAWMVPAVAHTSGHNGTFWRTDVSLHNPHVYDLPVVVQFLPSDTVNYHVLTLDITLYPWETYNLWDVLGEDVFDTSGTGALLAYVDPDSFDCGSAGACDFLVTSRTYTLDPYFHDGEFGQGIPGHTLAEGTDWWTFGYAAGVLNDGDAFRCNFGVASWTGSWVTVRADVQDASGDILATEELRVPPYGHVQRRLGTAMSGGSLVFYLVDGPDDTVIFPYASVVDETTGDPSFYAASPSEVGVSIDKVRPQGEREPSYPAAAGEVLRLDRDRLDQVRPRG